MSGTPDLQRERERRANTMRYFEAEGLAEGRDWRWGTLEDWDSPGVCDEGRTLEVNERLTPLDPGALPIMIRSSGVRILGGPRLAAAMDAGLFPAEMPFVVMLPHGQSPN
jgi:hypothetical protein